MRAAERHERVARPNINAGYIYTNPCCPDYYISSMLSLVMGG